MSTNVLMPQLGESITEGTIVKWNKEVGDSVDRDEPLFDISTDKVDAEVPSPTAGVVLEIKAGEGATVPVDSVVAIIGKAGEEISELATKSSQKGNSIQEEVTKSTSRSKVSTLIEGSTSDQRRIRLSPVVRQLAREHNVDLSTVKGTGTDGRITKADVLKHVETGSSDNIQVEPMTIIRRKIAEHMVMSRSTSAHVHTVFEVDLFHVSRLRETRKAEYKDKGAKLTFLAFIAKAVVDALSEVPIVNASLDGENVLLKRDINIGIAVALDGGLIVPVIKRTNDSSVLELSLAISDLAERARTKRLTPDEVEGGTFTITNPGTFGSLFGMPIINQPQLAILCVGAIEKRPVVIENKIDIRPSVYLSLGFDHRVIDGAMADKFMALIKTNLEQFDENLL